MATLPTGWDREIKPEAPEIQLQDAIANSPIAPKRTVRIILDGKIHRFAVEGDKGGEKAGWYIGFGDNIPAGMFGSWHGGGFEAKWRGGNIANKSPPQSKTSCRPSRLPCRNTHI